MIDNFAIAVTHFLLALAALRLVMRADLDRDPVAQGTAAQTPDADATGIQMPLHQMETRRG